MRCPGWAHGIAHYAGSCSERRCSSVTTLTDGREWTVQAPFRFLVGQECGAACAVSREPVAPLLRGYLVTARTLVVAQTV